MYSVDIYNRVRRASLKDGMSAREAARYFNKDRKTIAKMLRHELPPGYQRSEPPRRPTLDNYVGVIDEIPRSDKGPAHFRVEIYTTGSNRAATNNNNQSPIQIRTMLVQGPTCALARVIALLPNFGPPVARVFGLYHGSRLATLP
jgi:hypothetical protein